MTPLDAIGEVHCNVTRGHLPFQLDALVVKQLDVDVLVGNSFLVRNDIAVRSCKKQIIIGDADIVHYGTEGGKTSFLSVRRMKAFPLRSPRKTVVFPGDYLELHTPHDGNSDTMWALEPRMDSRSNMWSKLERAWSSPQEILSVDGALRVLNDTGVPMVSSGEHICHTRQIASVTATVDPDFRSTCTSLSSNNNSATLYATGVSIDPDSCLSKEMSMH